MDEQDEDKLLNSRLHRKLLYRLDLEKLGKTSGNSARDEILVLIRAEVNAEVVPLSFAERERLAQEILDELFRGNLEGGDAAGIAVKKPRNPNLISGAAAASLDELLG
jgi:hypothetical protein